MTTQTPAPSSHAAPGHAVPATGQESPEALALKHAFLRGAGLSPDALSHELTPELMELLGKLMAHTLQGTIDLLAMRSLVKQEVKADVTMVLVRNNNPLKFFPDSATVLTQMLRKKMPGFMEPLESVDDAWHDLRGHQLGVVAGTRASMDAMMARLSPSKVEAKLKPPGLLEKIMPSVRTSALWEQYARRHGAISAEAQDNFKNLFGPDFLAAYEKEVERFNDGTRNG